MIRLCFTALFAALVLCSAGAQSAASPPQVTVYFSERPPFSIVEGQKGILVNLTKAVLVEAGIRPRFIELPPARIVELLKTGQSDALGMGVFRAADVGWARYSLPLYQDKPCVALVNSRVAPTLGNPVRLDALLASGLTLGLKAGTSMGPYMDQKIRALGLVPLETVVDIPQLLKMIQGGRMDYTLLEEEEARYLLKQDASLAVGLSVVRLADPPAGNERYLVFPASFNAAWASRIDSAIERVRASAQYAELVSVD